MKLTPEEAVKSIAEVYEKLKPLRKKWRKQWEKETKRLVDELFAEKTRKVAK